jgi:phosphomannomutase/phosphomannomutase/phosphoglucomutase
MTDLTCFKAYDIRGKLGEELNEEIAYRIGRAFAQFLQAKRVVIGCDIRLSSESLKQALAKGLMDSGCDVVDLGMTGTEEIYFAAFHLDVDGGIEVTASHNPIDFNGMKLVARGAKPISGDSGLKAIQKLAEENQFSESKTKGSLSKHALLNEYINHLLTYVNSKQFRPLKIVVNAGNGAAGHVIDALEEKFKALNAPLKFIKVHHLPNGNFPNGIPNPLLPENRSATAEAVKQHGADLGIAWDGDFDRCFLFDENGDFIEGYYIVGLLAEAFLQKHPGEKIIHDPRLTWNTIAIAKQHKGTAIQSKTGHAFIKERMRAENAIYGGEMSAHHYFRDFAYCDSGMIPWLLVAELMSTSSKPLSQLVKDQIKAFPCSGEINYKVKNAQACLNRIEQHFANTTLQTDHTDGLSMEFANWRFNIRTSNTEPLLRLNIESKADKGLIKRQNKEIEQLIASRTNPTQRDSFNQKNPFE